MQQLKAGVAAGTFALAVSLLIQCTLPGAAVRVRPTLKMADQNSGAGIGFITIAHIPAGIEVLSLMVEDADVQLIHSDTTTDILISANQPGHWNISGSEVRQAAIANSHGVAMLADRLGSRCIADGKVYVLPPGPIKGGISLSKEGVMVAGKVIEPLTGSTVPGIGSGGALGLCDKNKMGKLKEPVSPPDGQACETGFDSGRFRDSLEIVVPKSFNGNLKIGAACRSTIHLSSWNGGKIEAYLTGDGSLTAQKLVQLAKFILDVSGNGSADINNLEAKVLVVNINGGGKISITAADAGMSNATINGHGTITLNGKFKNLKQAVQGSGTISVSN